MALPEEIIAFNDWCIKNNRAIFYPTPQDQHQCTKECKFFKVKKHVHVCESNRHVHKCTNSCGTIADGSQFLCSLTYSYVDERAVNCYWNDDQTLTSNRGRRQVLNKTDKEKIILGFLNKIFLNEERKRVETRNNFQNWKMNCRKSAKQARKKKLKKSDWQSFYFLTLKSFKENRRRFIPNNSCLEKLSKNIYKFWCQLFPTTTFLVRKVGMFTATCVYELILGTSPLFPKIPWLQDTIELKKSPSIYKIISVSSRLMTAMMSTIQDKHSKDPTILFPTEL